MPSGHGYSYSVTRGHILFTTVPGRVHVSIYPRQRKRPYIVFLPFEALAHSEVSHGWRVRDEPPVSSMLRECSVQPIDASSGDQRSLTHIHIATHVSWQRNIREFVGFPSEFR
jgi:hypothetical protein